MEYTRLGRSGLKVSKLCLGTMNFGPETDEADSHKILDLALDSGVNFVDTANVYGRSAGKGRTEEILGAWFAGDAARREQTVLATKIYGSMREAPGASGLSARNIVRECEASLRRLQTDRIDLYQMHHVDRAVSWDEIWQAMETLVAAGKILYVGSSNFAGWHIAQACEVARSRHFLGLVSEQSLYNLAERTIELEVLPAARKYGVGVIPWSPLHGGALSGFLSRPEGERRRSSGGRAPEYVEANRDRIVAYEEFCDGLIYGPAEVALAWLLHQDGVTAPIIGPRTVDQFQDLLSVPDIVFEPEELRRLDEIFPGPGGEAPEAYAW